jgi:hypothetical protein
MENDRFQVNHKLYFVGLISLVLSLSLFAFSFYIMPNLLFGWFYDTPSFIIQLVSWLQYQHDFSSSSASRTIFFVFFILGCFFALLAYIASNRIDNEIFKDVLEGETEPETEKTVKSSRGDGFRLTLKIILMVIGVVIVSMLFEWLIYTPPPSSDNDYAYHKDGSIVNGLTVIR